MKSHYIPTLMLFIFLLFSADISAQKKMVEIRERPNAIKSNFLSPISLGYERGFLNHFSLSAFLSYFPEYSFGEVDEGGGKVSFEKPSTGFTFQARYYTGKESNMVNFYLGAYYRYRLLEASGHKIITTTTSTEVTTYDVLVTVPSNISSIGAVIGFQTVSRRGLVFDINAGAGRYKLANIPTFDVPENSSVRFERLEKLSDKRTGIGPRVEISLGYAF